MTDQFDQIISGLKPESVEDLAQKLVIEGIKAGEGQPNKFHEIRNNMFNGKLIKVLELLINRDNQSPDLDIQGTILGAIESARIDNIQQKEEYLKLLNKFKKFNDLDLDNATDFTVLCLLGCVGLFLNRNNFTDQEIENSNLSAQNTKKLKEIKQVFSRPF